MTRLAPGVPLAVLSFLAAAILLRRRSSPCALAAIGVTIAPIPALFAWFSAARGLVVRFHAISAMEPRAMGAATTAALSAVNREVLDAQIVTAAVAGLVLVISIAALVVSRKPAGRPVAAPDSRSRVVSVTALVALVVSVFVYELGTDTLLFPLAVVASQQGRADPNLPLTTEAARALFMDQSSQDAISAKVGEYLGATTVGSVIAMTLCAGGFAIGLITSTGAAFSRSSGVVGLVLAILLVSATVREVARHHALEGELAIVTSRAGGEAK